ncbi:MAG: phosphoenolpyruvate carboxykinase [Candidatus Atribacteria bacterium]|nr:phosphoenolpyruvate carboxykinase [Candidatus Atribacteria bacterium]
MAKEERDFRIIGKKAILHIEDRVCETPSELLESRAFREVLQRAVETLRRKNSPLLRIFGEKVEKEDLDLLIQAFGLLTKIPLDVLPRVLPGSENFLKHRMELHGLVEYLYNFWRGFDRFIISVSERRNLDKRPYRTFNATIETLAHLVRSTYRDIQENIANRHPRVYRQVRAGANIAVIAVPREIPLPASYSEKLRRIPIIRQILLHPPLILEPPMNKRTGRFEKIGENPLAQMEFPEREWLAYPAKVGPLLVLIYIHEKFYELGFSLCNLFELADDEDLKRKPDAIYAFGVPGEALDTLAPFPTVFFDDEEKGILVAACPNRDEFGYFGYLKKMVLTLHNIVMMKQGRLPFHGALVRFTFVNGKEVSLLLIGDTGAGKSETLEAFRVLDEERVSDMSIIADDMGSLQIEEGVVRGYGTEIGAFLRLDDLQPGYAFGQIDRAIIMSPSKVNARVVLPVTSFEKVMAGYPVDVILYANNYEEVDDEHPIIERFTNPEEALRVFAAGAVMSKGTTTSTGIVHSYFANIFGPPQYRTLHDALASRFFAEFFRMGLFVGQIRTRLGIPGWEQKGPEEAARELLRILEKE